MPIRPLLNIYAFGQKFLVACPGCSKRAELINRGRSGETNIILTCTGCGWKQHWQEPYNQIMLMGTWRRVDLGGGPSALLPTPAGHAGSVVWVWVETSPDTTKKSQGQALRLWLQRSCGQETLWFLNAEHLLWTQSILEVPNGPRPRSYNTEKKRQKRLWLPQWVTRHEDKEAILSCLEAIRMES